MNRMSPRATMSVACAGIFALGLITAALGPALPNLASLTGSTLSAMGGIFTALFLGALLAQVATGPINDRFGPRPVLMGGLLLLAAGTVGLTLSRSLAATLALTVVAGLGHGAADVGFILLVPRLFLARSVSAMNLLAFFFGAGAVAGPAVASVSLRLMDSALPALWLGAAVVALGVPLVPALSTGTTASQPISAGPGAAPGSPLASPLLWALGGLLLVYVGVENAIGGWTTTYLELTTGMAVASAALATSGFWGALTAGRMLGAALGERLAPSRLLLTSLAGALAGGALLVFSGGNAVLSIGAILLLGLSFGPIYPTAVAITSDQFTPNAGTATSAVVALGSLGGMLIPAVQGVLIDRQGAPAGAWLVLACTAAMLLLKAGQKRPISPNVG